MLSVELQVNHVQNHAWQETSYSAHHQAILECLVIPLRCTLPQQACGADCTYSTVYSMFQVTGITFLVIVRFVIHVKCRDSPSHLESQSMSNSKSSLYTVAYQSSKGKTDGFISFEEQTDGCLHAVSSQRNSLWFSSLHMLCHALSLNFK